MQVPATHSTRLPTTEVRAEADWMLVDLKRISKERSDPSRPGRFFQDGRDGDWVEQGFGCGRVPATSSPCRTRMCPLPERLGKQEMSAKVRAAGFFPAMAPGRTKTGAAPDSLLLMRLRWLCWSVLLWGAVVSAQTIPAPSLVLQGEVRPAQNQTYFEVPFTVPAGTHRITVTFHNLGKEQHTVLDLGIVDPFRFRGQSGGNKDHFTLSETDATPSYLAGGDPAGTVEAAACGAEYSRGRDVAVSRRGLV